MALAGVAAFLRAYGIEPETWWAESGMDVPDLRAILVHVLTETAVHAGHLDAVRELIDGRQWIML